MTHVFHFVHSINPENGGVAEAVVSLNKQLIEMGVHSEVTDNPDFLTSKSAVIVAHGLWQWPSAQAYLRFKQNDIPYVLFPHGMLDPWFKKAYRLKHLKKQIYWWCKELKFISNAKALCFTTEEECLLARKTFWPYSCNEFVTGLGVKDPPNNVTEQCATFLSEYPKLRDKKVLLYLGRFHPKKGVDLLINSFSRKSSKNEVLVLGGPIDQPDKYLKGLQKLAKKLPQKIIWTGMLHGDLKWGALHCADALILPSHQENYGMVVAEALSAETPVFLTNKVNLWREVIDSNCGIVAQNDQNGIDTLIEKWSRNEHAKMQSNAGLCFRNKLHIQKAAKKICKVLEVVTP